MNQNELRETIRTAIIEDRLPRSGSNPRVFGGRGEGVPCAACHALIEPSDIQYDVDCRLGEALQTLSMHRWCFQVWESESRALVGAAGHSVCEDAA
jgi:hypothetical protein